MNKGNDEDIAGCLSVCAPFGTSIGCFYALHWAVKLMGELDVDKFASYATYSV
jgi:hypothetical protein